MTPINLQIFWLLLTVKQAEFTTILLLKKNGGQQSPYREHTPGIENEFNYGAGQRLPRYLGFNTPVICQVLYINQLSNNLEAFYLINDTLC